VLGTFGEIGFLHRVIGQVVQLKTIAIDAMQLPRPIGPGGMPVHGLLLIGNSIVPI